MICGSSRQIEARYSVCHVEKEKSMLSTVDVYRAAHLVLHAYGSDAELAVAHCERMMRQGGRDELLNWFRISRTIAVMREMPSDLVH